MPSDSTTLSVDDTTPAAPDATCLAVEALRHTMREMWPGDQLPTSHLSISSQLGDREHLYARELALIDAETLKLDLDHVWTVDGEPLGIRHEIQLDGAHVIARDVGIKNGAQHGPAHERRIPLIQAVHVLLNATAAELEAIENRLVDAPGTGTDAAEDNRCSSPPAMSASPDPECLMCEGQPPVEIKGVVQHCEGCCEPTLHEVSAHICSLCLDGAGGECHVPGCVFWGHDAPTPVERGCTLRTLLIGVGSIDGATTYPDEPDDDDGLSSRDSVPEESSP